MLQVYSHSPRVGGIRFVAALLLFACILAACTVPANAQASQFKPGSTCYVETQAGQDPVDLVRRPGLWTCGKPAWSSEPEKLMVRFDMRERDAATPAPRFIKLLRQEFAKMELLAIARDGTVTSRQLGRSGLEDGKRVWEAYARLPTTRSAPVAILMSVERPLFAKRLYDAQLVANPPFAKVAGIEHLLAALLCGLLLAPLFFDLGFFRTLGDRFPLYHGLFCLLATIQTATVSGLTQMVLGLDNASLRIVAILSFDFMIAASAIFVLSFIEREKLGRVMRNWLAALAALAAGLGLLVAFGARMIGPAIVSIYYGGYLIYLLSVAVIFTTVWRRQSEAIRYVVLAFAALILVGTGRVLTNLVPAIDLTIDDVWAQNAALLFEVLVTAFAVTSRFMRLKHERDMAVRTARDMAELSERDPLTGLLNRRAIEARFAMLRASGFTALAAIDLDHFKQINDRYGHATGDLVLQSVARTLLEADQEDTLSFRIGGEEFILLMRGKNARARAEALRKQIASNIARDTPVREQITASMGFVDAANKALPTTDFPSLYKRVDRLLYEAKAAGRNRTVSERLKVFKPRARDRRAVA